jgi:hypothetical protein
MELDLQSLFGLHVYSCSHWLRRRNLRLPPRIWAHILGRYWSAKIEEWPTHSRSGRHTLGVADTL